MTKRPDVSEFDSVDPAPPSIEQDIVELRHTIIDENERMFIRMRALFALRNIGGDDAVEALAAAFDSDSALLKHEIAYVMGQMQNPVAVPYLTDRLCDMDEDSMVRHEAAEALGAIGHPSAVETLEKFRDDPEVVISESCEVALDLLEWVASKSFEYPEFKVGSM
tara:strand:- start:1354 stop:1848 length:495 start_codon:yes stop_codon:yes gene_type:complete